MQLPSCISRSSLSRRVPTATDMEFAGRMAWDRKVDAREDAAEFLRRCEDMAFALEEDRLSRNGGPLDPVAFLRERHVTTPARRRLQTFPERFHREPDIFLRPLRYGRLRLLLQRVFGRRVWRIGGAA